MKWRGRRQSDNVEDRRGESGGFGFPGFPGGGRMPQGRGVRRGGIGILGFVAIIVLSMVFGFDPSVLLQGMNGAPVGVPRGQGQQMPGPSGGGSADKDDLDDFVAVVLADTEEVWSTLFSGSGRKYAEPKLVLYSGYIRSACGLGQAAAGPFYCPGDRKVYLDLQFFRELGRKFHAPGDFAQAYVIAHEIGHHVQMLLGIAEKVERARGRMGERQGNQLQVKMELQADCLAGVWANHAQRTKKILDEGDIDEALQAASSVGDDTIQRRTQGHVVPDAFTHGSSAQRVTWFKRGFAGGSTNDCDTFNANSL